MNIHQTTSSSVATSSGFISFVQNHLRLAHAQVRAVANELATIGSALHGGDISAESAVAMLHDSGLDWVTEPST